MPKMNRVKIQEPMLTPRPQSEKVMRKWEQAHFEGFKAAAHLVRCEQAEVAIARRLRVKCLHCDTVKAFGAWRFIQRYEDIFGEQTLLAVDRCEIECSVCGRSIRIDQHPRCKQILELAKRMGKRFEQIFPVVYDQYGQNADARRARPVKK